MVILALRQVLERPKTATIFYSCLAFAVCFSTPLLAAPSTRTAPTSGTQVSQVLTLGQVQSPTPSRSVAAVNIGY